jgi:hypothetical protein
MSPYLFFVAYDWQNQSNTNNDYLVHFAALNEIPIDEQQVPEVPEPATLSLLTGGLLAWGASRRRSRKS